MNCECERTCQLEQTRLMASQQRIAIVDDEQIHHPEFGTQSQTCTTVCVCTKRPDLMEFQLLTALLEDRLPRGFASYEEDARPVRDRILDGVDDDATCSVDHSFHGGCVAVLFGRTSHGASVCVRVEGVRPCLYTKMAQGETIDDVTAELSNELPDGMRVMAYEREMCHFYGYEPDPDAPSGRVVHRYAEVRYPSLRAFRHAKAARTNSELARVEVEVACLEAELPREDPHLLRRQRHLDTLRSLAGDDRQPPCDHWEELRPLEELQVEPLTRFLQEASLTPSRWYRVTHSSMPDVLVSTCDLEVTTRSWTVFEPLTRELDAPYVTLSYDIETLGLDSAVHPVVQVGMVFTRERVRERHLVALGRVDSIPDATVHSCATEVEVLLTTRRLIVERDPDFVVAYNGINFDNSFLDARAAHHNVQDFYLLSRFATRACRLREQQLSSAGTGDNVLHFFDLPGRVNLDWYVKLKRDLPSEPSYKLDHFARKFCGVHKEDLASGLRWRRVAGPGSGTAVPDCPAALRDALQNAPQSTIVFEQAHWDSFGVTLLACHFVPLETSPPSHARPIDVNYRAIAPLQSGTSADRARLGSYCLHDSDLLEMLNESRTMLVEILRFCGVFHVVPEWIYFRGQQVRYVSQLLRKLRIAESVPLLINRPAGGWHGEGVEGYEGATVNDPRRGFHRVPVAVLDWKSLYPSIMMSHNLCPSTLILDDVHALDQSKVVEHCVSSELAVKFTIGHRGILPRILEELMHERSQVKKQIKQHLKAAKEAGVEEDRDRETALAKVCDGRQLALKVAANSIYGACGAVATGKVPCLAVSAATTFQGRQAMVIKKQILPERFPGIDIIYGDTDSVMVTFADALTDVQTCAQRSVEAAEFVTDYFVSTLKLPHMELEFEKIYWPYLLEDKKRYIGYKYEPDNTGTPVCKGIDAKGVETERKDTLPYTKVIMLEVRDALMRDMDEQAALRLFSSRMDALVRDEVPMEQLIMRKNLSHKVVHKTGQIAHARVNALRREREAGSESAVNEQVEYVILDGHRTMRTTELAEDPAYAREHNLPLNRLWYFEHHIRDAIGKMFVFFPQLDYPRVCERYSALLASVRLGVDSAVLAQAVRTTEDRLAAPPRTRLPLPPSDTLPKRRRKR